jgi:SAM-dependent methyltransferase
MLLTLSKHVHAPNVTHALHAVQPVSAQQFKDGQPMLSPTASEPERRIAPPRAEFDVAVANLVLHHIDDTGSFLAGVLGLLKPGGWFVITEFGLREDGELTDLEKQMRDGKVGYSPSFPSPPSALRY